MKPDFMDITAKIIADIRTSTCIDAADAEVIEKILQDALIEYHSEVFTYGHGIGYDDGHSDGYAAGKSILEGDVDIAYDKGYALGYDDGYSLGYDDGQLDCAKGDTI